MGREIDGDTTETEVPMADYPQGTDMDLVTGLGHKGGANGRGTWQRKQERGAERRDKRPRLAGDGWGKSTDGR